jgi:hypothetical protein
VSTLNLYPHFTNKKNSATISTKVCSIQLFVAAAAAVAAVSQ